MKSKIIKYSHKLGLKTFMLEVKWKVNGLSNPLWKIIAYPIGWINNLQMKFHKYLIKCQV